MRTGPVLGLPRRMCLISRRYRVIAFPATPRMAPASSFVSSSSAIDTLDRVAAVAAGGDVGVT